MKFHFGRKNREQAAVFLPSPSAEYRLVRRECPAHAVCSAAVGCGVCSAAAGHAVRACAPVGQEGVSVVRASYAATAAFLLARARAEEEAARRAAEKRESSRAFLRQNAARACGAAAGKAAAEACGYAADGGRSAAEVCGYAALEEGFLRLSRLRGLNVAARLAARG